MPKQRHDDNTQEARNAQALHDESHHLVRRAQASHDESHHVYRTVSINIRTYSMYRSLPSLPRQAELHSCARFFQTPVPRQLKLY